MMVRLPYDVPFWQIALSVVLLYATACAVVWIAGRIYRTGILLYGKKTSFKEILRWIK
jgi:ABC-2 type transport system permease protein